MLKEDRVAADVEGKSVEKMDKLLAALERATKQVRAAREKKLEAERAELAREREEAEERSVCVICAEAPRALVFVPCGHVCCCEECGEISALGWAGGRAGGAGAGLTWRSGRVPRVPGGRRAARQGAHCVAPSIGTIVIAACSLVRSVAGVGAARHGGGFDGPSPTPHPTEAAEVVQAPFP